MQRGARTGDGSPLSRMPTRELVTDNADSMSHDETGQSAYRASSSLRVDASPSRRLSITSANHKTPARSYFQSSFSESHAPIDIAQTISRSVREDTAELASFVLSDYHNTAASPSQHVDPQTQSQSSHSNHPHSRLEESPAIEPKQTERPEPIIERSEPASVGTSRSSSRSQSRSALTELLRSNHDTSERDSHRIVTVNEGIISQPTEQTTLLLKKAAYRSDSSPRYGSIQDLENLKAIQKGSSSVKAAQARQFRGGPQQSLAKLRNFAGWNRHEFWKYGIRQPLTYIPPIFVGLLLNVLDALSYGMILFPLSQAPFTKLGPDGISMFYVSCIVSQLVFSCGGSIFKGGIGSEMIEVVPFFHKMANTIVQQIGEEKPKEVFATTVLSYALSSILTGIVFFMMGQCHVGTLIGFFPRHILLGCIGGVGLFLILTGLEVSGRLEGSFQFDLQTLDALLQAETALQWTIPLALAVLLMIGKRWIKYPMTDAAYFISIIGLFYIFTTAIPSLDLDLLRDKGWVFEAPDADVPFYHFYTLYDFKAVDWEALASTVPAMFALTFFGILHVPINIPALGLSTGEDNVNIDRELRAHGLSNAFSGLLGSIQNYLVYTNTVLFIRSGGDSRIAGIMLACATAGILVVGTAIIGYVPVMVVGSLIFFLGIDLMREALVDTWGRVHRLDYLTIIIIVATMGFWDFVSGILAGIVLACVSFVLQTAQISAIRGKLFGGVANSTVRRHPIQQQFLQAAGQQIYVMKLAGYLFFGTIVGVENQIRELLDENFKTQPIRFLILDLFNVDGVDFSAAEAFNRIQRILSAKNVRLVVCGTPLDGEVGKSLRNVGFFDEDSVQYFLSLNSGLEYCENELLKAFYHEREMTRKVNAEHNYLEIPGSTKPRSAPLEQGVENSPRQTHLQHVATMTLSEQNPAPAARWETYQQPLQLILHTFCTVSDQPEDFWVPAAAYFEREEFPAGSVLYHVGEPAAAFYVLEHGILKAKYELPQGNYSELIVAGTTCGELPFFSSTLRTSTTVAERDSITWKLGRAGWEAMQRQKPHIAQEMLIIGLKLTSERMEAITKYMLLTSG